MVISWFSIVWTSVKDEHPKREITAYFRFFFDKSQAAKNTNTVYGPDAVIANYAQFWSRRFRSDNYDVKTAPRSEGPIDEVIETI